MNHAVVISSPTLPRSASFQTRPSQATFYHSAGSQTPAPVSFTKRPSTVRNLVTIYNWLSTADLYTPSPIDKKKEGLTHVNVSGLTKMFANKIRDRELVFRQ